MYDALGRRVQKAAGGVIRTYLYDAEDIVEERVGADVIGYVYVPGIDNVLARSSSGSGATYYLSDHLGSVMQETNALAQVIVTREYDPWGRALQSGATSGFAFTGREWDSETGLLFDRARYYDPAASRFIGADPSRLVDGPNLYGYVRNKPLGFRDPSGRNAVVGAVVGGSVAGPVGAVVGGVAGAEQYPHETEPENTLKDLEETQRGFRKGGREQVESTERSKQRFKQRPKC